LVVVLPLGLLAVDESLLTLSPALMGSLAVYIIGSLLWLKSE
jgi:hypothetical protein